MTTKFSVSIGRSHSTINAMLQNSKQPVTPIQQEPKSRAGRRLVAATLLIGLAIGGLALIDRFRVRPTGLTAPHEPSQALINAPAADESGAPTSKAGTAILPPPPPPVVSNKTLLLPSREPVPSPAAQDVKAGDTPLVPGKAYMIQAGVFNSPANAQALQKQLRRAGIEAHLETRVQLGPFKDKRDADKALARARKLGINAVLVVSR